MSRMHSVHSFYCFALQTEEFPALEEGDESVASQSVAMDQEVALSQSDTPDQLEQEVIVIVTDTESENDQEEEDEEEEEQVECFCCRFKNIYNIYISGEGGICVLKFLGFLPTII